MAHRNGPGHISNLTEIELASFETGINVADGHARYDLTAPQQKLIGLLPDLFSQAAGEPVLTLDREAQCAFLSALGQDTATASADVLTCYSSSVAMEIFSRAVHAAGIRRAAVIHPTFDNIPDILRGVGIDLVPVSEEGLADGSAALPAGTEVLFITTPNNPTGTVIPPGVLAHWARACAARGIILALDTSFRGFDDRAQYDYYAILAAEGCRYVVIEDTGKLWPTLDLKAGFLVFPPAEQLPLRRIHTDILLGISPLILLLLRHFADDASDGGLAELHRFVAGNRLLLRRTLGTVPALAFADPASRISVERLTVPAGTTGTAVWRELRERSVHVLPCRQFYWADPDAGERYVRIALSRPPEMIAAVGAVIRDYAENG